MSDNLVAFSRQGDIFHYRWAARRCLALVNPNTPLTEIVIEGSREIEKNGEYVIDVTEYYLDSQDQETIKYYQLKHTTVQGHTPFVISDLKDTFEGFAKRYSQHLKNKSDASISFSIVTNRNIENAFKLNISLLAQNKTVNNRFRDTIETYTNLSGAELTQFCTLIEFEDNEGNYDNQKDELSFQIGQLIAGTVDNAHIANIVEIVQEKAAAIKNKSINREDILKRFGFSSANDLFPAPAIWEQSENFIEREQHETLKEKILKSSNSVIVHAPGGVGKSVFCRQIVNSLSLGSIGIAYDCFGAGQYRSTSKFRHRHRDALVQIINELAVKGLCEPLLIQSSSLDSDIMKKFLWRIEAAVGTLKQSNSSAELFILIDAADNAEMAASDFAQPCFANELLRESIPDGCKLVFLCRTERIHLLKPSSKILQLKLDGFSKSESLQNLRIHFPEADEKDGSEFHRLTSGNPRVQAFSLNNGITSITDLFNSLGPKGTSVQQQIEMQLETAVNNIKDDLTANFQQEVQSICVGLACLPPHIPIEILAKAANVPIESIKSFVTGIGRSLWLSDEAVQFRDEPTETWFSEKYLADKKQFEDYIKTLEPLAIGHTYVAEILPHLYHRAEKYDELIRLALSDEHLPEDNPIDARNVRVNRLQFAFRAALKTRQYNDAVKISMRAGEEVAGNQRQLNLLQNNIDLLVSLQDKQKVQDIAFKRVLNSTWNGSENVFTASLLSGIDEYKGEARVYLRASLNWFQIYHEELAKSKDENFRIRNEMHDADILEIAFALFNIYGGPECIDFFNRFRSKRYVFNIMRSFARRLIDQGKFEAIDSLLALVVKQPYYCVAITYELLKIGKIPNKTLIEPCLDLLLTAKTRIEKPRYIDHNDIITPAIIAFVEIALINGLPSKKILRVLDHYIPEKPSQSIYTNHFSNERSTFLKALAIRLLLDGKELNIDDVLPQHLIADKKKNRYEYDNDVNEVKEVINGLFPWYFLRAKILNNCDINFDEAVKQANQDSIKGKQNRYRSYDTLPSEIVNLQASILVLSNRANVESIRSFYKSHIENNKALSIETELKITHAAFRSEHLSALKHQIEQHAYKRIKSITEDGPDEISERYIKLARAVLISSEDDAGIYFEEAVSIVSKFGDEIVMRWDAIVSIAKQASINNVSDELAYRFIRCAELVGENVSREKHWDRSEATAISARLSSGVGISALSRWRDRRIGRFNYQLQALLRELVKSDKITSSVCWSLSKLLDNPNHEDLLLICLQKESDSLIKIKIFADALKKLQVEGIDAAYWGRLKEIAVEHGIQNDDLDKIINYYKSNSICSPKSDSENEEIHELPSKQKLKKIDWNIFFGEHDVLNLEQFEKIFQIFKKRSKNHYYESQKSFWVELFLRLDEKDLYKFIDVVLASSLSKYEIKNVFDAIPNEWLKKVSYVKKWPDIVRQLGEKYATELTTFGYITFFIEDFDLNEERIRDLKDGIFEGLSNDYRFSDAETFFGFVKLAIPYVNPTTTSDLLDYGLSRFELHFEKDFGDGEWSEWLYTTNNINKNCAGFIWSALGSPRATERWNAVHAVRALGDFSNIEIIDELVSWMQKDKVEAFGNPKFPFYNLHARLYLLIAFARISIDSPQLLVKHTDTFIEYAFGEPHILIQKYSSDLAINLLKASNKKENDQLLQKLVELGKTSLPVIEVDYNKTVNSYWHENNLVSTDYDFHFGWDFDKYWFEPLGDVFGIPEKQVEDIAADVIINEWQLGGRNGYNNDPRVALWNSHSSERETWHDHGSYPKTDNLDFYLSYHSMMVAAGKLIQKMPVTSKRDWHENQWEYWLERHILTCDDGKWLSDYRDSLPLKRPQWVFEKKQDTWKANISDNDFFEALVDIDGKQTWLNVAGNWTEKKDEQIESFAISSALVSSNTSSALMRALQSNSDPYSYKLPDYEESHEEINSKPFRLQGWIKDHSSSNEIDKRDPYAGNISYPPIQISNEVISQLNLITEDSGKTWRTLKNPSAALKNETWSSAGNENEEELDQAGKRLKASPQFLKQLCSTLNCDLILTIRITRSISYKYRSKEEKYEYPKPIHKAFIISSDGKLRTTGADYQLG